MKNRTIPTELLPDKPVIITDEEWWNRHPDEWPCPNLIHDCRICGKRCHGKELYIEHYKDFHNTSATQYEALDNCDAFPADENWTEITP